MADPTLRPELVGTLPVRMQRLPIARGFPVPWFVTWIDGEPEFRIMDGEKFVRALRFGLCWVCGQAMGAYKAFTIGPMCAVNRISSEPPSHRECAEFSARACPFLSRPHARRREGGIPDDASPAGHMIRRNPGVALVWITKQFDRVKTDNGPSRVGNTLFQIGDPTEILCFTEGRPSTPEEIRASVDSGYPLLLDAARQDGSGAVRQLEREAVVARRLLGIT